jgi:hypothetical protein
MSAFSLWVWLRASAGKCFRLYTAHSFENEMEDNTVPEIQVCMARRVPAHVWMLADKAHDAPHRIMCVLSVAPPLLQAHCARRVSAPVA